MSGSFTATPTSLFAGMFCCVCIQNQLQVFIQFDFHCLKQHQARVKAYFPHNGLSRTCPLSPLIWANKIAILLKRLRVSSPYIAL
jgi:hypothetical protein